MAYAAKHIQRTRRAAEVSRNPAGIAEDRRRQGVQARPAAHGDHPRSTTPPWPRRVSPPASSAWSRTRSAVWSPSWSKSAPVEDAAVAGDPGPVLEPLGMGGLIRQQGRAVACDDSKFHLPESRLGATKAAKGRCSRDFDDEISALVWSRQCWRQSQDRPAHSTSKSCFRTSTGRCPVVAWDDGTIGCVAEVSAPGESFSIWTCRTGRSACSSTRPPGSSAKATPPTLKFRSTAVPRGI